MKYRKLHFSVLNLLFAVFSIAAVGQTELRPVVDWSPAYQEPKNSNFNRILTQRGNLTYGLRTGTTGRLSRKPKVYIEVFDENLKLKKSKELDLEYKKKQREFAQVVTIQDRWYFLTTFTNEGKKRKYLFAQELDFDRLTVDRSLTLIGEVPIQNRDRTGFFGLQISSDSTKILVYNELPYKRKDPEQFALSVYDAQFQPLWNKDIILPYNDEVLSVEEYQIAPSGNVFLVCKRYQDGSTRESRGGDPNYEYVILAYSNSGETYDEYVLDLGDKFISELTLRIDKNEKLVAAGFYSDQSASRVKGTCFFKIDPDTKELVSENLRPFDFSFVSADLSDREIRRAQSKNDDPELYEYSLDELILRSDGGALLIAEQYYVYERTFRNWDGTINVDYFYHYNDIIIVNIRPDGTIEWASRIPKQQETVNDRGYFSSYVHAVVRDRIYLLFNTNPKNFSADRKNNRMYNFDSRQAVIAVAEVKIDGSVEVNPIRESLNTDALFRPKVSRQTKLYEIMVYGEGNRSFRLGKISFVKE